MIISKIIAGASVTSAAKAAEDEIRSRGTKRGAIRERGGETGAGVKGDDEVARSNRRGRSGRDRHDEIEREPDAQQSGAERSGRDSDAESGGIGMDPIQELFGGAAGDADKASRKSSRSKSSKGKSQRSRSEK